MQGIEFLQSDVSGGRRDESEAVVPTSGRKSVFDGMRTNVGRVRKREMVKYFRIKARALWRGNFTKSFQVLHHQSFIRLTIKLPISHLTLCLL